jgi:uncharacterized protein
MENSYEGAAFTNEEIQIPLLPRSENLHLIPLSENYKKLMYLNALISIVLPVGWVVAAFIFDLWKIPLLGFGVLAVTLLIFGLNFAVIPLAFKYKGYALRERDLVYQTGLIARSLTLLPFNRVQHCEINRGPLSRLLGLSELNVFTAGGSASDLVIPGLTVEEAEKISAFILKKVEEESDEEE